MKIVMMIMTIVRWRMRMRMRMRLRKSEESILITMIKLISMMATTFRKYFA